MATATITLTASSVQRLANLVKPALKQEIGRLNSRASGGPYGASDVDSANAQKLQKGASIIVQDWLEERAREWDAREESAASVTPILSRPDIGTVDTDF